MICNSCGGVLGRDCFNQRECAQITASINSEGYNNSNEPQLSFAGYNFPYKKVGGVPEDKFLLQPHPEPNDIVILDNPFEDKEQEIERLEQIVAHQGKTILRQANTINELSDKEAKIADKDLIWGLHQVIKFQEKEIQLLKDELTGHLRKCIPY